jgi:hypothetical protein
VNPVVVGRHATAEERTDGRQEYGNQMEHESTVVTSHNTTTTHLRPRNASCDLNTSGAFDYGQAQKSAETMKIEMRCGAARGSDSSEAEFHFNGRLNGDGLAVAICRPELPLLDSFDRLTVESESDSANYLNVCRQSIRIDSQAQCDRALEPGFPGFVRIVRLHPVHKNRRRRMIRSNIGTRRMWLRFHGWLSAPIIVQPHVSSRTSARRRREIAHA